MALVWSTLQRQGEPMTMKVPAGVCTGELPQRSPGRPQCLLWQCSEPIEPQHASRQILCSFHAVPRTAVEGASAVAQQPIVLSRAWDSQKAVVLTLLEK